MFVPTFQKSQRKLNNLARAPGERRQAGNSGTASVLRGLSWGRAFPHVTQQRACLCRFHSGDGKCSGDQELGTEYGSGEVASEGRSEGWKRLGEKRWRGDPAGPERAPSGRRLEWGSGLGTALGTKMGT